MTGIKGNAPMFKQFDEIQVMGQTNIEATTNAFQTFSKNAQTIASEIADYSQRSIENGGKAIEKLFAVKSPDKAFEVQTEFAKAAYEDFTAQVTKLTSMYAELAKEVFRPYESLVAKSPFAKSF
jgi:hypothetical protein